MATEISQLLTAWREGDEAAINELMPLVYDELRRLAHSYLRREHNQVTLQPTALVNEAYLRLIAQENISWENRAQFFGLAAKIMRNVLVDAARRRHAAKRGNQEIMLTLGAADRFGLQSDVNLLALEDSLQTFAALKPEHARVVELRFFGGLSIEETAAVMNLSSRTVERHWTFAKAWLKKEITNL